MELPDAAALLLLFRELPAEATELLDATQVEAEAAGLLETAPQLALALLAAPQLPPYEETTDADAVAALYHELALAVTV